MRAVYPDAEGFIERDGVKVGYLAQEPQLDPAKDVAGNVADGVGEIKSLLDRFNEVCAAFAEPDADFDALLSEQSDLQAKIDAAAISHVHSPCPANANRVSNFRSLTNVSRLIRALRRPASP